MGLYKVPSHAELKLWKQAQDKEVASTLSGCHAASNAIPRLPAVKAVKPVSFAKANRMGLYTVPSHELPKQAQEREAASTLSGCSASPNAIHQKTRSQEKKIILSKSEDNYEMTDSDSESDSSEASRQRAISRAKKPIPKWAQTKELNEALEYQHSKECPIDPDEQFGEFKTCDLCEIFPNTNSEKRYKRRTSSGDWTDHQLTEEEKARYKQQISLMKT
jgi:hypothetical protein